MKKNIQKQPLNNQNVRKQNMPFRFKDGKIKRWMYNLRLCLR